MKQWKDGWYSIKTDITYTQFIIRIYSEWFEKIFRCDGEWKPARRGGLRVNLLSSSHITVSKYWKNKEDMMKDMFAELL